MPQQEMELAESRRRYWRSNLRMTGALLALWFAVTFGGTYYARELSFNCLLPDRLVLRALHGETGHPPWRAGM